MENGYFGEKKAASLGSYSSTDYQVCYLNCVFILLSNIYFRQVGMLSQQLQRPPQGKEVPPTSSSLPPVPPVAENECSTRCSSPVTPSMSNKSPPSSVAPSKVYVSHCDVEKKRKQKISDCIQQLSAILCLQSQVGKLVSGILHIFYLTFKQ